MKKRNVKIRIETFEKETDEVLCETLWAEPLGNGLFQLLNSPFYAYEISYLDIVHAIPEDDSNFMFDFKEVVERGGHSTYRIIFPKKLDENEVEKTLKPLTDLNCTYEGAWNKLICIDVPPEVNIFEVFKRLEEGEINNFWEFEEAHYEHVKKS